MTWSGRGAIIAQFVRARWRAHILHGTALRSYQERRARSMTRYVRQYSPFYSEHWAGHNSEDWRTLPPVDKQIMMREFNRFNTRGLDREQAMAVALHAEQSRDFSPTLQGYTVGLSSGTSGHRGLFVTNPEEQAAWAGTILARTLHRIRPTNVAFFLRSNSNLYEQIGGRFVRFRYFDLMTPIDEVCRALNHMQPTLLVAPASLLGILSGLQDSRTLYIRPERVISVAEVLEPQDRASIAAAFNAPVHEIYQCTEGLLAISCRYGSLHVQEDIVALQYEPLPGSNDRVTPIVTDLWRRTQPIIRYRLNDVLRLEPARCACGSDWQVIVAIEGRCDDVCMFETTSGEQRLVFADTIRRMLLFASPHIEDYLVTQSTLSKLQISLQVMNEAVFDDVAHSVRGSVMTILTEYGCRVDDITIEQGLPAPAPGAKRRRVIRNSQLTIDKQ